MTCLRSFQFLAQARLLTLQFSFSFFELNEGLPYPLLSLQAKEQTIMDGEEKGVRSFLKLP